MAEESSSYFLGGEQSRAGQHFYAMTLAQGSCKQRPSSLGTQTASASADSLGQANGSHVGTGTWSGPRWFEPGGAGNLRPQLVALRETIGPERPHGDSQSY